MRNLLLAIFVVSSFAVALEKTIQVLTPSRGGIKPIIVSVSYQVQHPLLSGTKFRAHPFPGLRQLIVSGKVSKILYISKAGEIFEILNFPFSKTERRKLLQQVVYGTLEGVSGESLPLSDEARDELALYFISTYQEQPTLEGLSKLFFLLQRNKNTGFDREKACAFLKANQKILMEHGGITQAALDSLLKEKCPVGSG